MRQSSILLVVIFIERFTISGSSPQGVNDTTYICANDKNVVKYISAFLNNGKLNPTTVSSTSRLLKNTLVILFLGLECVTNAHSAYHCLCPCVAFTYIEV